MPSSKSFMFAIIYFVALGITAWLVASKVRALKQRQGGQSSQPPAAVLAVIGVVAGIAILLSIAFALRGH